MCPMGTRTCVPRSPDLGQGELAHASGQQRGHPRDVGTWGGGIELLRYETSLHPRSAQGRFMSKRLLIQMRLGITKGFVFQEAY